MVAQRYKHTPIKELVKTPSVYPASFDVKGASHVIVEVGPGRGDFLFYLAEANPKSTVVSIEIKRKRADKIINRIEKRGLKNVFVVHDDARTALPRFFRDGSVNEIHINFPDPWPKNRHAKNRLLTPELIAECRRILKVGGSVSIATDYIPHAEAVRDDVSRLTGLKSIYPKIICSEVPDAYPTLFSEKWKKEGRKIAYQKYVKVDEKKGPTL